MKKYYKDVIKQYLIDFSKRYEGCDIDPKESAFIIRLEKFGCKVDYGIQYNEKMNCCIMNFVPKKSESIPEELLFAAIQGQLLSLENITVETLREAEDSMFLPFWEFAGKFR